MDIHVNLKDNFSNKGFWAIFQGGLKCNDGELSPQALENEFDELLLEDYNEDEDEDDSAKFMEINLEDQQLSNVQVCRTHFKKDQAFNLSVDDLSTL